MATDRSAQPEHGQQAAAQFGAGGAQDEQLARAPAELFEEAGRAGDAVAAEPAEEFLGTVPGDGQADDETNDEERDIHVCLPATSERSCIGYLLMVS
jgi:hypothetical protein